MSIRPVDMHLTMPRAMEASRTGAHDNARPNIENQQFSQQLQKNVQQEQQSVVQPNRSEGQNIHRDGKGNSGGYNRQKKRRNPGTPEDQTEQKGERKGLLDISL